jgi:hypothetical protein
MDNPLIEFGGVVICRTILVKILDFMESLVSEVQCPKMLFESSKEFQKIVDVSIIVREISINNMDRFILFLWETFTKVSGHIDTLFLICIDTILLQLKCISDFLHESFNLVCLSLEDRRLLKFRSSAGWCVCVSG